MTPSGGLLSGRYVAVVGPADGARPEDLEHAEAVGRLLAEQDAILLTGGHHGVMAAAARGSRSAGGVSIGLMPGVDRSAGSPDHSYLLPTGLGELRNGLLVRSADVLLAIGGAWGTLSEIALAVRTGVPVFAVESWDLPEPVRHCADVEEAVAQILDR